MASITVTTNDPNQVNMIATSSQTQPDSKPIEPFDAIEAPNDAEPEFPTGAKFVFIFISISLVLILGGLDGNIVATAVPSITDHFHTVADIGWYSAAFRLPACAFQFVFGKLYKIFSVKWTMITNVVIFLLGSVVCASAVSSWMFILGRSICGLGGSGIIAGCFTLLLQILPLRRRPVYTGIFGAIESVAGITAPFLGGALTQSLSWRWCFWISLPVGGIAAILMAILLPDLKVSRSNEMTWKSIVNELDLLGTLALVPSITSLFLALTWAGTKYPYNSPIVIILFVSFAVLACVFAWDQHRKQDASLLPPRIIKRRSIIAGFIFTVCCNGAITVVDFYLPTYFQIVRGWSPARSGYMTIPASIAFLVGILLHGAGTTITGFYTPFMLLASILMPIAAGLMTTWTLHTTVPKLILYSVLAHFASAIGFQGPQSAVQATLGDADGPLGLSVILFGQNFGPALFVSVAQAIFTNRLAWNLCGVVHGLEPKDVEQMGFSELKASVGAEKLEGVLGSFDRSVTQTWSLPVALTCVTMVGSALMEWRSVKVRRS